ncbi:50S ribosomal protein L2 [Candidatus Woesearchaeota archaeon]|nr:50S ribosomal protein L2P [uncultured archaeon]MBS3139412.1 50S ribosomal protein L2 [Candidatus Woesearchaeota archaeon]
MGKRLIQQRRGHGSLTYRTPGFRYKAEVSHLTQSGTVVDLLHCPAHSTPLMEIAYANGDRTRTVAPEGITVGDYLSVDSTELRSGNVMSLKDIPEGTLIHNIELRPGDGGKMVRTSGSAARIVAKDEHHIRVLLPSRKEKILLPDCRAAIGVLAGSGRKDKPFLKAGRRFMKMRARNKVYPRVCGISMNAVNHPFGGKCSHVKGRPTQSPRSAPPGRKVGKIAPRRTGRRR